MSLKQKKTLKKPISFKKTMKKLLLFLALLPMMASADPILIEDIWYFLDNTDMTAEVTNSEGGSTWAKSYSGDVIIPSSVSYNNETYIVKSIGGRAFCHCQLQTVTLPETIVSLGESAFSYTGLRAITIPESVTSIGRYAFWECGFISVTIPEGVTSIGSACFWGCTNLISIKIPSSASIDSHNLFNGCNNLAFVFIDVATPPSFSDNAFPVKNTLIVPNGSKEAYANADVWKDFANIFTIDEFAELPKIQFKDQNVKSVCVNTWDFNSDGELNTYEAMGVNDIGTTFQGNTNILKFDELCYFKGITNIPSDAFNGCTNLRAITIPENVNTISGYWYYIAEKHFGAFRNCSSLTSINIPSKITQIDQEAFIGCNNLNAVHITDLTAWCNISFHDSNSSNPLALAHHLYLNDEEVTEVVIPNSITSVNARAFEGASSLTSVSIPEGVTTIGNRAFRGCSGISTVTIPTSVTTIGENVFENSGLTAVNTTDLGAWCGISFANANCNPLTLAHHLLLNDEEVTSLTIPNGITEIKPYAFYNCSSIASVNIPEGVTTIGNEAFRNCSSLTSVTLPEGVTTVGDNAFNTGNLLDVTLPSTLYGFGNTAFGSNLKYVAVMADEPPLIGETAFPNRTNAMLVVPQGSTSAYQEEMYWEDFKSFVEYPGGDVNLDGDTNMVDVVDIVRFVVGTPRAAFVELMADLNNSNSVNVADAVVLVNEIAGDVNYAKPSLAPRMADDVLTLTGDGNRLVLLMDGSGQYAAMQFDLWLPEGMDVTDVQLNDNRKEGHQLLYNKVGKGHYRVVAISTAANAFRGTSGELLAMTLDGFATGDIRMDNIHFVTPRGGDIPFDALGISHGSTPTAIASPSEEQGSSTIYNLNGQRLTAPQKGLNIVNGKKYVVK